MPATSYRLQTDPARFVVTPDGEAFDTRPAHGKRFELVTALRDGKVLHLVRDFADGREIPFHSLWAAMGAIGRLRNNPRGYLGWPLGSPIGYVVEAILVVPEPLGASPRYELATDDNGLTLLRDYAIGVEIPFVSRSTAEELFPAFCEGRVDHRLYLTRPIGL